jgi:pilus assembly protein CpaE
LKRTLGVTPFKAVPNSYEAVATAVNQGRPLASFARSNAVAKVLQEIAQQLARPPAVGTAFLRKLVGRRS